MLDRDEVIAIVREAYAARMDGDKAALAGFFAEDAHFEIAGDRTLIPDVAMTAATPMGAISTLIDQFDFSDLEEVDWVVEGHTVAVRWRLTVAVAGKPPQVTELFDLIRLDDDGKVCSFVQFADTALVRHMVS